MEIVCDTSFLMVLCCQPVKNIDLLGSMSGKTTLVVHPKVVRELAQIKHHGKIKRSKMANLALEMVSKGIENKNFRYAVDNGGDGGGGDDVGGPEGGGNNAKSLRGGPVDSHLLNLSLRKKSPLATIDKVLMKRALSRGADVVTLKNNTIVFLRTADRPS